jgi:hypothetical protein
VNEQECINAYRSALPGGARLIPHHQPRLPSYQIFLGLARASLYASHGNVKADIDQHQHAGRLTLRVAWTMPDVFEAGSPQRHRQCGLCACLIQFDSIHGTWGPSVEVGDGL